MDEYALRGFIRGTLLLLEKEREAMEEYHIDLCREPTSMESQDRGHLFGRLGAYQEILELVEGLE